VRRKGLLSRDQLEGAVMRRLAVLQVVTELGYIQQMYLTKYLRYSSNSNRALPSAHPFVGGNWWRSVVPNPKDFCPVNRSLMMFRGIPQMTFFRKFLPLQPCNLSGLL
jgi:hypothetical protein